MVIKKHEGSRDASTGSAGTTAGGEPVISAEGLGKSYGPLRVLSGIDVNIASGEVVTLIGPSGSGKSTLIRCLNLLETPSEGTLTVGGRELVRNGKVRATAAEVRRHRTTVGMVFQSFNLFPNLNALENVALAQIHTLGRTRAEADDRARTLLERVGLGERLDHHPDQLSGGQQQRVAIARALAMDPQVMLFDEPTSAIDPELRVEVLKVMRDLAEEGMTMAIVTHELSFARRVSDRVLFLADGGIVEQGPAAQVMEEPQHERTRRFIAAVEETEL